MHDEEFDGMSDDVRVIGAAQTSVGSDDHQLDFFISALGQQRVGLLQDGASARLLRTATICRA